VTDSPQEIATLFIEVNGLADQLVATVTDEQIEERLNALFLAELSEAMTRPIPDEPCCDMSNHPHMHVRPADD